MEASPIQSKEIEIAPGMTEPGVLRESTATRFGAVVGKHLQGALHQCDKLVKLANDGFSFIDGNIAESYLAGNLYLCIGIVENSAVSQVGHCYAMVKAVQSPVKDQSDLSPTGSEVRCASDLASIRSSNDFEMFVDVAKSEDGAKCFVPAPSIIRFQSKHELYKIGINAFGVGLTAGSEPLHAIARGEIDLLDVGFGDGNASQLHGDLIQDGSQVINDLSREDVSFFGRLGAQFYLQKIVSGLRINLDNKFRSASLEKDVLDICELDQKLLCPLNFQSRAVKQRACHVERPQP
jgi:hypothetical protein